MSESPLSNLFTWVTENITDEDIYVHGVHQVLCHRKTKYQELAIVDNGSQGIGLVLDGKWQSCTGDEFLYHEPLVHVPLATHGEVKKVLVLGGGEGATLREILKWHDIEKAVMVDIDGEVVEACREYMPMMSDGAFDDPRVELVIGDAFDYLNQTDERFDVIISDLSDPIEDGPSYKLFTKEYMQQCKALMNPGAIFTIQAGPAAPYNMYLHVRLINTLAHVFDSAVNYISTTPTYCSPWGFGMGRDGESLTREVDVKQVDQLLSEKTNGQFRMFDALCMQGLLSVGKHIREAIDSETVVYSLEKPAVYKW